MLYTQLLVGSVKITQRCSIVHVFQHALNGGDRGPDDVDAELRVLGAVGQSEWTADPLRACWRSTVPPLGVRQPSVTNY